MPDSDLNRIFGVNPVHKDPADPEPAKGESPDGAERPKLTLWKVNVGRATVVDYALDEEFSGGVVVGRKLRRVEGAGGVRTKELGRGETFYSPDDMEKYNSPGMTPKFVKVRD